MAKQQTKKSAESKVEDSTEVQKTSDGEQEQEQAPEQSAQTGYSDVTEQPEPPQEGFKGVGGANDATDDPREADSKVKSEGKPEGVPEGRIIAEGEDFTFEGERIGNMVVVKEDVYRKVYPRGTKRPSYILLARAGSWQPAQGVQNLDLGSGGSTEPQDDSDTHDDNDN
jgi:hypothetical protein